MQEYKVEIEQFQGPLAVLLELIEKQELELSDVSLSSITEDFLAHIEQVEKVAPMDVADFLVIAGRLLYLKSKILLPEMVVEEEDDGDLAGQLKLYQRFAIASAQLADIASSNRVAYKGARMKVEVPQFSPPVKLTAQDLADSLKGAISKVKPYLDLPERMMERAVSVEEKIEDLKKRISRGAKTYFHDLAERGSKSDVVASFLALLELLKQNVVAVEQGGLFEDIAISRLDSEK